jgi:hypothetical protein
VAWYARTITNTQTPDGHPPPTNRRPALVVLVPTTTLTPNVQPFVATWLFNHTGGSVLMTLVMHAAEGTIRPNELWSVGAAQVQAGLVYSVVWCAVVVGLVIFDWKAWRGAAAAGTTTPPAIPPRGAAPVAP